jgi:hypothetical protein
MVGHSETIQLSLVATWMKSRLLVEVTPPQPLYQSLMELRPSHGQIGTLSISSPGGREI